MRIADLPLPANMGAEASGRASPEVELRTLQDLATDVLGRLDLEETLLSVLNAATNLVDADIAGILLADGDGVRMRACTGHRTVATARLYVGRGQGVAGRVFDTGMPYKVDDYESDQVISRHFIQIARDEGKRSALGVPLTVRGETLGTLMVWRRRPSVFTDADIRILSTLGDFAAIAIVNARLYQAQRETVERLELANAKLATQNDLMFRSSELHDELTAVVLESRDLHALVAIVARHAGGAACILDRGFAVLAASEAFPVYVARIADRVRQPDGDLDGSSTSVVNPDHDCDNWLLFTPVVANGETLGYVALQLSRAPELLDPVILERASIVCALHLVHQQAIWEAEARMHAEFLWDLLDCDIHGEAEARLLASHFGLTLPDPLRVVLVETNEPSEHSNPQLDPALPERQRGLLVRAVERAARDACGEPCLGALRGSTVALLIPGIQDVNAARSVGAAIIKGLLRSLGHVGARVGLSGSASLSADLSYPHGQAQKALAAVAHLGSEIPVAAFDGLGVLRFLLGAHDDGDLRDFVRSVIGPLLDYDRCHNIDLVKTLEAYLSADCNLQRTAQNLYVHSKTVRYRLDRLEDMSGLDLNRQDDRFRAQLALSIVQAGQLGQAESA